MRSKLLGDAHGLRTFAVIFDAGDDPIEGLKEFAKREQLHASSFTAIGAFREATLGWFDWEKKEYKKIPVDEQVEVLALTGDVAREGDVHKVHAHVVVGTSEGAARGGHLLKAIVRPTLEVFLTESPTELRRTFDPQSKITLIQAV